MPSSLDNRLNLRLVLTDYKGNYYYRHYFYSHYTFHIFQDVRICGILTLLQSDQMDLLRMHMTALLVLGSA